MSPNRKAALGYLAAVLIPLVLGTQWIRFSPALQQLPGYIYLLLIALTARFLGFGPAIAGTMASTAVLASYIYFRLFPAEGAALRLFLFLVAAVVIAGVSRRGSEEAREANERYRSLVELSPDGIVVTDEAGKIVFANSALAKIVGAEDAASIIGRNSLDFMKPEEHEGARRRIDQLVAGRPTPWVVSWAIRVDGSVVQIERAGVPLRIGGKVFAQGFVRDVTEREESRRRLQALFDTAIDGIVFIDSDGRYVDANPAFCDMLGYTREEILRMKVTDIPPVDQRDNALAVWQEAIEGKRISGEVRLQRKDGEILEIEYRFVGNVLPALHCALIHDVTARNQAERSLAQLSARLLRSQDEERRRIARQLHETTAQNLAALKMDLSRMSRSSAAADPGIRSWLDESIALTDQSIVEVRTLAYLLHPPLIDEAGLLPSLRWLARGFEERSGIKVTLDAPEEMERLPAESETALFRIVQEALTNVQRHSGSPAAHIRLRRQSDHLHLEVEDEGRGLPEHLRSRDGDAFAAAGVGIAAMQQRIRELGGKIEIGSTDHGTKIALTLPLKAGDG
jgi:two-component system, NarL family, sensor kinase